MFETEYHRPQAPPEPRPEDTNGMRTALRKRLSLAIKKAVEARDLTHADAALIARTPRTSITAIVHGNLERVSMDRLVTIANRLGVGISIRLTPPHAINTLKS